MKWTKGLHRARVAANELIDMLSIETPEQLSGSLESIAAFRGAVVTRAALHGVDGILVRDGDDGLITVSSTHPITRQNFSIAHELGHFELHQGINQLCTNRDMRDYRRSPVEREANCYAANLLMPDSMFAPLVEGRRPGVDLVSEIAQRFGTSLTATAIRLIEMHDGRCAVVVSDRDGPRWAGESESFGVRVNTKRKLSSYSYASDVLNGEDVPASPSEVDPDTWLYFDTLRDGARLLESSMPLRAGEVLSILWIRER